MERLELQVTLGKDLEGTCLTPFTSGQSQQTSALTWLKRCGFGIPSLGPGGACVPCIGC